MRLPERVRVVLFAGLSSVSLLVFAQNREIDSLRQVLSTLPKDDERYVHALWKAMNANVQTDNQQAARYAGEAYLITQESFPALKDRATISFAERLVFIELLDSAELILKDYHQSPTSGPVDSALLIKYYLTNGSLASRRTQLKEAGDHFNSALKVARHLGDFKNVGSALLRLGSIYLRQEMDSMALEYYLQAIAVYKKLGSENGLSPTYSNISIIYSHFGNYTYSDLYLDSTLRIEERKGNVESLIGTYGNVVINAVDRRKDFERAGRYLKKLKQTVAKSTTPRSIGFAANVEATYHIGRGNYLLARDAALIAYEIGNENKIMFILSNAYENLVDATEGLKQFESAYLYQKEWNAFKDSINLIEQENMLVELKTQYETEKKEAENQRLQLANLQQIGLNRILGGGGLLLLFLLASLLYFYRGKQKANRKLEAQKQQIETNLHEKEALLREIHHRVKNNLQIISSLLNMQTYHLQDPDMINAIAEGQSRVKAMALIHQKLYQTDKLSEIDFQEYAEQLMSNLADAFGEKNKRIRRMINGSALKLDIDTAIPLGLILNELITNAYKYAFTTVDEGDLKVDLKLDEERCYHLHISDSGQGLPADFDETRLSSMGLKLVRMLIEQLEGSLSISSEPGASFYIKFKETKLTA